MVGKWLVIGGTVLAALIGGRIDSASANWQCPVGIEPGGPNNSGIACVWIEPPPEPQYNPGSGSSPAPDPGFVALPKHIRDFDEYKELRNSKYGFSFIAVAWHPQSSDVWATWNQRNEPKAVQTVLNACNQAMGGGCTLAVKGWNGSAAFARDQNQALWQGWGATPQQAREVALNSCQAAKQGCAVVHTFTAEPLKQKKTRNNEEYAKFLQDPAFDVSQSYFPDRKGDKPATSGKTLFSDPQVGTWSMLSAADGTGKNCAVSFTEAANGSNTVLFFGPTAKESGAILFQGPGMPATSAIKEIRPTLTFKGSQPMPINAALIPQGGNSGILVLIDMVNMMRQTNAENEVTLHLDGKEVFRGSMTGFMKARSAMLECMKAE